LCDDPRFRIRLDKHQKIQIGAVVKALPLRVGAKCGDGEHAILRCIVGGDLFHAAQ
jgi:hypothetical protein